MTHHDESAFTFDCNGEQLVGFLHKGDQHCDLGVLTLVAGGPQYRGGVGRQLVNLGRRLAAEGISVMRFDHRGIGDSEGTFRGFQHVHDDIAAAIDVFRKRAPNIRGVILWGGCDAATAALINAHRFPEVICVIAGNPFVSSETTSRKVARRHYLSRLMQRSFWMKLVRLEYDPGEYAAAALAKVRRKLSMSRRVDPGVAGGDESGGFLDQLLTGLRLFDGRVLFLMGDRFLLSEEFDTLVESSADWRSAYGKASYERINIKDGDQVFSTRAVQERMFDAASDWIHGAFPERMVLDRPPVQHAVGPSTDRQSLA